MLGIPTALFIRVVAVPMPITCSTRNELDTCKVRLTKFGVMCRRDVSMKPCVIIRNAEERINLYEAKESLGKFSCHRARLVAPNVDLAG